MTSKLTRGPLFAEVHNVPDDYHFTAEELDRIIAGDMFTPRQGAIMARELQERRKAAMDGEPVQMFGIGSIFKPQRVIEQEADCDDCAHYNPKICHGEGCPAISQQSTQPAPVVPEIDRKAIADKVYGKCSRIPGATFYNAAEFAIDEMEARRAAMLAAAPHDTPALNSLQSVDSVAGKWIPVSERMPDVGVKVLCFPVKDEPIHATFNGQLWLQDVSWSGSDDTIDNVIPVSVTHWMPLPAAPQEVSHG